jgi:uncharacterized membrane protein
MAAIGFRLRSLMKENSFSGFMKAYSLSAVLSSGPWVLSILGIFLIGILNTENEIVPDFVGEFQISITYLMAMSLLVTSPLQLMFTRFISDKIYEEREEMILQNLLGAIVFISIVNGTLSALFVSIFFEQSFLYKVLFHIDFIVLSVNWIILVVLSSLKDFRGILIAFLLGYGVTVLASVCFKSYELEGLMAGFTLGQCLLFATIWFLVLRANKNTWQVSFAFLKKDQIFISLAITGIFYNLAIWIDKFVFWFTPHTSKAIISPFRSSDLYDLPVFLAYLSILPGMAVFLLKIETDFAENHRKYYRAISEGKPLGVILERFEVMRASISDGLLAIAKIQSLTVLSLVVYANQVLAIVNISPNYKALLRIDLVAVGIQVVYLAALNILFYFDLRKDAMMLCLLFFFLNFSLSLLSIQLGPLYYGYGFALAIMISTAAALLVLYRRLDKLVYMTFMLR